jgi:hypothetical protein
LEDFISSLNQQILHFLFQENILQQADQNKIWNINLAI